MKNCEFCNSEEVVITVLYYDDAELNKGQIQHWCAKCWNKIDFSKVYSKG